MKKTKQKRNAPIATLIKNYINKKSGKVSESREEIKWRFNALDWKDQKKILSAFLKSGISDREWAYGKVLDYWDESFLPKIKELWETYHEYKCSWSVIRHFPLEYIKEHIGDFTERRDYYFICLRLAKEEDFIIDRTKLSNTDYLALLYHTNRVISEEDARDTLFTIVHDCCLEDTFMVRLEHLDRGKHHNVITPLNFREVNLAFYYVIKLQRYDVAAEFKHWNEAIEEAIYNSQEFKAIDRNESFLDYEYDRHRIEVTNIYAFMALDNKYKSSSDPSVEQMRQELKRGLERRQEWERIQRRVSATPTISNSDEEEESPPF